MARFFTWHDIEIVLMEQYDPAKDTGLFEKSVHEKLQH